MPVESFSSDPGSPRSSSPCRAGQPRWEGASREPALPSLVLPTGRSGIGWVKPPLPASFWNIRCGSMKFIAPSSTNVFRLLMPGVVGG